MNLGYYKIAGSSVGDPSFATDGSACFDLRADLSRNIPIKGFTGDELKVLPLLIQEDTKGKFITLSPSEHLRWMIPTGLIFDIPVGYHVAVYMRGGSGLKRGIRLANGTGIIDWDYVDETRLLLQNLSGQEMRIDHNERLCQAILHVNVDTQLVPLTESPAQKTTRTAGFNSTGRM